MGRNLNKNSIRKNTKGIIKVAIFLKERDKSLLRTRVNQLNKLLLLLISIYPIELLWN